MTEIGKEAARLEREAVIAYLRELVAEYRPLNALSATTLESAIEGLQRLDHLSNEYVSIPRLTVEKG